jgi:hemerythrin-like domain-containing protein
MSLQRQTSQALDREHEATLDLLRRVEHAFTRAASPGAEGKRELTSVAAAFASHIERELRRHFEFEERELFPRFEASGEGDIADLLLEEHHAIRATAAELLPLAAAAVAATLDDAGWAQLKRSSLEMVGRLVAHIEKETIGLLPMLDDLLDDDNDLELASQYAAA